MIYRTATEKDIEQIKHVLHQCYNIESPDEGEKAVKEELEKRYNFIIAEEEGKVLGFASWRMHGLPKHQLCELDRIAVLPEVRGKGVAKELFNALAKEADESYKKHGFRLRKLYLMTHADNKRAHSFYEKMGLTHETMLKSHFYHDKDEAVFSKFF